MTHPATTLTSCFGKKVEKKQETEPTLALEPIPRIPEPQGHAQGSNRHWLKPAVGLVAVVLFLYHMIGQTIELYVVPLISYFFYGGNLVISRIPSYQFGHPTLVNIVNLSVVMAVVASLSKMAIQRRWSVLILWGIIWFFMEGFFANPYARTSWQCCSVALLTTATAFYRPKRYP